MAETNLYYWTDENERLKVRDAVIIKKWNEITVEFDKLDDFAFARIVDILGDYIARPTQKNADAVQMIADQTGFAPVDLLKWYEIDI